MKIKYTKTRSGNYLINSIESLQTWGEIESEYGLEIKACYLSSYPFINNEGGRLRMYISQYHSELMAVGMEYYPEEFKTFMEIILKAEKRLKDIIEFVEQDEEWDSSDLNNFK